MQKRMTVVVVTLALLAAVAFPSHGWAQGGQGANSQNPEGPPEAARRFGNQQAAPSAPFPAGWRPCPRCQNDADRARDNQTYKVEGHPYDAHDLTGVWGWDGVANAFRDGKGAPTLTPEGKARFD